MANIFLISDTHFGHKNILNFPSWTEKGKRMRPYWDNIEDMNAAIIENWNNVVKPNDYVYHLGDFCLGARKNVHIASRLNGKKRLVMGNHEHFKAKDYLNYFDDVMGVKEIDRHILSHYPLHESQKARYKANVHGHLHEALIDDSWYINVSCEQINYTPISFEEIKVKNE